MTDTKHFDSNEPLNYSQVLGTAMEITDAADAANYLTAYEGYLVRRWSETPEKAHEIALANIGYYAGYYDFETRQRVQSLFNAVHPVFGSVEKGEPTVEEAFKLGYERGQQMKDKR